MPLLSSPCSMQPKLLQPAPQLPPHHLARNRLIVHRYRHARVSLHQLQLADVARVVVDELDGGGLQAVLAHALQLRHDAVGRLARSDCSVQRCGGQFIHANGVRRQHRLERRCTHSWMKRWRLTGSAMDMMKVSASTAISEQPTLWNSK